MKKWLSPETQQSGWFRSRLGHDARRSREINAAPGRNEINVEHDKGKTRAIEDRQADRRRGEKKETRREKEDRQPTTGSVDSTRSHKLRVDALEAGGRNSDARRRLPGHLTATTQKQGRNVA